MRVPSLATCVGLAVVFLGPLLLLLPGLGRTLEQLVLWALFAALLGIVIGWEQRPLASIGVRPFAWGSLAFGLALAALLMWVVTPLSLRMLAALRLAGFEAGLASFAAFPLGLKLLAVLGAGVVEETLYRGFALERLAEASGSWLLAGAVTLAAFALIHLPMWGWGPVLTFFVSGAVLTAFYVWRQDLLANVVAHVVVDAMGLIVVPSLQRGG